MNDATRLRHFDNLYAASDDPWNVRGAWYEQRKRAVLLASLARPHYHSVFEPGCGNGEMSLALAPRCDTLLACDGAAGALDAARRRLAAAETGAHDHVRFEQRRLPHEWPTGAAFDLVILSELAYYLEPDALDALLAQAAASLAPGGELVLCHYLHDFDDRVMPTSAVHAAAHRIPGLARTLQHHDEAFLLEAWRRLPVAQGAP